MNNTINNVIKDNYDESIRIQNKLFDLLKYANDEDFLNYFTKIPNDIIDINMKDTSNNYLISIAIAMNKINALKLLIKNGARTDIIDTDGYSILYYPIRFNLAEIFDFLINNDRNLGFSMTNIIDKKFLTPITYAIKYYNVDALKKLLDRGADPDYRNVTNDGYLHMAILRKDIALIKMLINHVKNINLRNNSGLTPLHYAADFKMTDIVTLLLEKGADPNIPENKYDLYPFFYSVVQNDIKTTNIFMKYGCSPNKQDYLGNTILHYSVMYDYFDLITSITSIFEISNKIDYFNESTNINNNITYVDVNISNIDGFTIGHLLFKNYNPSNEKNCIKILPYLNLNAQDNSGNTVIHYIANANLWNKFKNILENMKLDIFIKNHQNVMVKDLINNNFIFDIVAKGYYNTLLKKKDKWLSDWENKCAENINDEKICIDYITNTIKNNNQSIPLSKRKIIIHIDDFDDVHHTTFTGSVLDIVCGYKYLQTKYDNVASFFTNNIIHKDTFDDREKIENNVEIQWSYHHAVFPHKFDASVKSFLTSNKYKFLCMPIGIILANGNHSNSLIFIKDTLTVERFEPHGSNYPTQFNYNPDMLDNIIQSRFKNIINEFYGKTMNFKYLSPKKYLPKIGLQMLDNVDININKNIGDPNGFCALWIIWYTDYRLKYHTTNPDILIRKIINNIRNKNLSFRTLIRNYSKKITDIRDKYLKLINKNINDYINNRISISEYQELYNQISID